MKRNALVILLMSLFASTVAFSQEHGKPKRKAAPKKGDMEQRMRLQRGQLELERQKSKLAFEKQMRELELDERRAKLKRQQKAPMHKKSYKHGGHSMMCPLILLFCLIVNILLTVWVYTDIRQRNSGSGIWVALTLLTGILGALVYAVVRLGDTAVPKS